MTVAEYKAILSMLELIQQEAYGKYTNVYMQQFNAQGGSMNPLSLPVPFQQRKQNTVSIEDVVVEAIQETNIAFVYQLNHAITFRAKLPQNQPPQRSAYQMIVDGLNYMADMVFEMRGQVAPMLPNNATTQQIVAFLQSILSILKLL